VQCIGRSTVKSLLTIWLTATVLCCTASDIAASPAASPALIDSELREEAWDLLEPFLGEHADGFQVDDGAAFTAAGRTRVIGHFGDEGDAGNDLPEGRLMAVIDTQHSMVCSIYSMGPVLLEVEPTEGSFRAEAERFARTHFAQWGETSQLIRDMRKGSGMHLYCWQNILPSGALTGGWCSVIIDAKRSGIVSFVQQNALVDNPESSVRVSKDEACKAAREAVTARVGEEVEVEVIGSQLILSYHAAPDYGPVWQVRMLLSLAGREALTARDMITIDATTGEVLSLPLEGLQ